MLTIYGIKNCGTMKKAFLALEQQGLNYQFHDYKKLGIQAEKIESWLKQVELAVLLNKKGSTWKTLSAEQQSAALADHAQLVATLVQYPSMIKRPVLEHAEGILVGFDAEQYQKLSQV